MTQQGTNKKRLLTECLVERWPNTFNYSEPKPLIVGIREEICAIAASEDEKKVLMIALNAYCRRLVYITCLVKYTHRYDLSGNESQIITESEKEYAVHQNDLFKAIRKDKLKKKINHIEEKRLASLSKSDEAKDEVKITPLILKSSTITPVITVKKKRKIM